MDKLVVKHLTKRFGSLVAVNDVSFEVKEGEIFSLLGPSGCGKTTTLRCIVGLEKPDSGEIYLEGQLINNLSPRERKIALVFQEFAVFPHMSVYDNLAFGLQVQGAKKPEIEAKVNNVAELLGLKDTLYANAGKLGLSEKQRIAIGRALVVEPKLLLLDEPLTLVDAKVREKMRSELKRIQKETHVTTIYVTHDQQEAIMLSDRVAVMNKGLLVQVGSPSEIYNNPADLFVAKFIGSPTMNFAEGELTEVDGSVVFKTKYEYSLKLPRNVKLTIPKKVLLGIRPENIKIHFDDKGKYWKGTIELIETSGYKFLYHVKIGEDLMVVSSKPIEKLKIGSEVSLELPAESIRIFDAENEKRIW
ncbi:MAG: ABC transporter ATP-binding protein [Candidatus Jordarchaeaceae archaeon]